MRRQGGTSMTGAFCICSLLCCSRCSEKSIYGYGGQAQVYPQADPAAVATQQTYTQAQYASFYQQ
ncbi:hypothetical protein Plhal304r1_c026g0088141 [Plasmopara halstedii]